MKKILFIVTSAIIIIVLLVLTGAIYTIDETQQVVITQFGKPIGKPVTDAGLHFKMPFIQQANYFEKRILEWDGSPNQVPTKDKRYICVDTTARWKIVDALRFLQSVGNEIGAHARLDDIIDSATRNFITGHNLVEIARDTNRIIEEKAIDLEKMDVVDIGQAAGELEIPWADEWHLVAHDFVAAAIVIRVGVVREFAPAFV